MAQPQYQPQPQYQHQPQVARRRPRRRRRPWSAILAFLLILAVVVVIADRAGSALAEREMRERVAAELAARNVNYATLDVGVSGVPFLSQVAQGRLEAISIDMTQVQMNADGRQATLPVLNIVASGVLVDPVELASGTTSVTAEQVTGTAVVSYSTLRGLIDLESYHITDIAFREEAGALRATANLSVFGVDLPIEAAVEVMIHDGQIELRLRDAVAVGQSLPEFGLAALEAIANAVLVAFLPPLPFGIVLDGIEVQQDGLAVTATGRDVTLAT